MENIPHRFIILLGGFLGFNATYFISLAVRNGPTQALIDSALGCLVVAILVRVALSVFSSSLEEMRKQKKETNKKTKAEPSHSF